MASVHYCQQGSVLTQCSKKYPMDSPGKQNENGLIIEPYLPRQHMNFKRVIIYP
jgi:hypothetical protein